MRESVEGDDGVPSVAFRLQSLVETDDDHGRSANSNSGLYVIAIPSFLSVDIIATKRQCFIFGL